MSKITKAAAIGGGVIGGGWIARLILNGIDVKVFDPAPGADRKVGEMLANAERAYGKLTPAPLPKPGKLEYTETLEEAVKDAQFIQESAPERMELKQSILNEIDKYAPADALVCSSTSGLMPTELQKGMNHPERMMVGHPFNPVYLLPLVEICGGEKTSDDAKQRAADFYEYIGMKPLVLRKEIDAFIADRILEAYWREALWLVNDGVATVEEVDDAIRYGAGLRWSMMGTFQVYRIAGGEAGMRHFMSQFGPALKWPWTKLMDVPELTDELIDTIAEQSDEQAKGVSIRDMERQRDDGLVSVMQALKTHDLAAGDVLKGYENSLYARAHSHVDDSKHDISKPLTLHTASVRPDWVDYNGHMTEHRYLQVFGDATDAFLRFIGMDQDYLARDRSVYTVESHIRHLQEVAAEQPLSVATQVLGLDEKRIRILHVMSHGETGDVLATSEHMLMHVDTAAGRACPLEAPLTDKVHPLWEAQRNLEKPDFAGRGIRELTA